MVCTLMSVRLHQLCRKLLTKLEPNSNEKEAICFHDGSARWPVKTTVKKCLCNELLNEYDAVNNTNQELVMYS